MLPHFNQIAGVELVTRAVAAGPLEARTPAGDVLPLAGGDDLLFTAKGAEVLAVRTDTGSPAFWRHRQGAGWVFVYAAPLESALALTPRAFEPDAAPCWKVYAEVARACRAPRAVEIETPFLAVTEHALADGRTVVVAVNHTAEVRHASGRLSAGFTFGEVWRGTVGGASPEKFSLEVPPHDAAVFALMRDA